MPGRDARLSQPPRRRATPITPDGFYITGDVFRRDADGFHYFVGRTDDMFVSGGENIYPADVERMLERHPDIAQAAVVPIDDEIKGQKPVAFVIREARPCADAEAVKRFALANAPAYQHPRFVWFVDELPLASTNKLDRAALHRMAEERVRRTHLTRDAPSSCTSERERARIERIRKPRRLAVCPNPLPSGEAVAYARPSSVSAGTTFTVLPGHLHRSAMMHFSHSGRRATQV